MQQFDDTLNPQRLAEQGRLIVPPSQQSPAVQRHRRRHRRPVEQIGPGAGQPGAIGRSGVGLVAIFQPGHQMTAGVVVDQHRPRPRERRRTHQAGAALGPGQHVDLERQTAALAEGRCDEAEAAPAGRAHPALAIDGIAAGKTAGRQHGIKHAAGQAGHGTDGGAQHEKCCAPTQSAVSTVPCRGASNPVPRRNAVTRGAARTSRPPGRDFTQEGRQAALRS